MKKLIMLSVFALGTITANASNDLFKNYYAEKADQGPILQIKYQKRHLVRQINLNSSGGMYETIVLDHTFCGTLTHHSRYGFIADEMYILNNTSGMPRFYNVHDQGFCL